MPGLTTKQQVFVECYLREWNGYKAAIAAGYAETSARHQASRMLSNDNIQAAIQTRLGELKMSADEVLVRLTATARGNIADVLRLPSIESPKPGTPPHAIDDWAIDLIKAQRTGAIRLVKKIKQGEHGPELEMYSAYDAQVQLGKALGLFVDKVEHSGALNLKGYTTKEASPDAWDDSPAD